MSHTGVAPEQSALVRQLTQICDPLHTGVGAEQSALVRQLTQRFATVSHLGAAALVQSASIEQTTHEPAFWPLVTHEGPPGLLRQSPLFWQALQVWVTMSHVGVEPLQSELNSQATQVPVGKSHTEPAAAQAVPLVGEHWPHAPCTWHAGVAPPQSASDAHALQTPPLHTGVLPPQSAGERHCTQVLAVVHRGALGGQLASATQSTQLPAWLPVVAHCGVDPPQSALLEQARQVWAAASQIGLGLEQSVLARQPTQMLAGTLQTGVAPVQAAWLVAEQTAQMPDVAHAGVAPLQAGSPSQLQGTPSVLSSSSKTSCWLICAPVPVDAVKPTYIWAPSWVTRLRAWLKSAVPGLVVVCER